MKCDVVIIGAGPAGLSFARSLANTNLNVLVIEKLSAGELRAPAVDGRDIALTHLSIKILKELGVWSRIPANSISPIKEARVLDGISSYSLNFDSRNASVDALGYLVPNHEIRKALYEEVETVTNTRIVTDSAVTSVSADSKSASVLLSDGESIEASLIVAADSRFSETRRKMGISAAMRDFGRVAIVCRMEHDKPHDSIAFECFHYGRTLAVLPMSGNQSSIVITVPTGISDAILGMTEEQFNVDIQRRFLNRLGGMKLIGERYPYPLVAVHADKFSTTRFALIGDAAVGMHPVTAHGFNLGLRGQATLAKEIKFALSQGRDFSAPEVLEKYQSKHMQVTKPLYLGTNGIVNLFTNDDLPAKILRKLVLGFSNNFAPVKYTIMNRLTELDEMFPRSRRFFSRMNPLK